MSAIPCMAYRAEKTKLENENKAEEKLESSGNYSVIVLIFSFFRWQSLC